MTMLYRSLVGKFGGV